MLPLLAQATATNPTPGWAWGVFVGLIVAALAVDLLIVNRQAHVQTIRQAGVWCVVWVGLALLFNVFTYFVKGRQPGLEFTTAYLVELSLSVDNLFIFLVIFRFFGVPPEHQHRTLFWGIVGAVVMRGIFIGAGVELLARFAWLVFVFGAILVFTGIKLLLSKEGSYKPSETLVFKLVKKYVPLTDCFHAQHFFAREAGRLVATPLFLVLMVIESTDVVFATDSIPACLAISRDAFIVYSSNIFAVLGLRSFYFLLSGAMGMLRFLKPALSVVLIFIGVKMVLAELGEGHWKIPTAVSLAVIAAVLGIAVVASLLFPAPPTEEAASPSPAKPSPDEGAKKLTIDG